MSMGANCIFFGWNRPIPGREKMSQEHFSDFTQFLEEAKKRGQITGFDTVFLSTHGGDMNGFFLIRGDADKLDTFVATTEWITHMTHAAMHLESAGAVRGHTAEMIPEMFGIWSKTIPA